MTVYQQIQKYFSVDSVTKFVSISSIYGWKWLNKSKTLPNLSSELKKYLLFKIWLQSDSVPHLGNKNYEKKNL
jgi:hypothetical protein